MRNPKNLVTFLDIGKRIHSLGKEYESIARTQATLIDGSPEYCTAHARLASLLAEQAALQDLVLAIQARDLTDAAVQLGVLFEELSEVCIPGVGVWEQSDDLARQIEKFQRALAGATLIVANAAGVELDAVFDPWLPTKLRTVLIGRMMDDRN